MEWWWWPVTSLLVTMSTRMVSLAGGLEEQVNGRLDGWKEEEMEENGRARDDSDRS